MPKNQQLTDIPGLDAVKSKNQRKFLQQARNSSVPDQGAFKNDMGGHRKLGNTNPKRGNRS